MKRLLIVMILLLTAAGGYILYVNRNNTTMSARQKILKAAYPLLMGFRRLSGTDKIRKNLQQVNPPASFYGLESVAINGDTVHFEQYRGKKVLLVNTASDCGYTAQYEELEKLYRQFEDRLVVIGFPANDFKEQEKGSDEEIAQFCKRNYGVSFPLMKKSRVIKGGEQNPVFQWLTDKSRNGWNERPPQWNFSKYLVDENGLLTACFATTVSPLSREMIEAIEAKAGK